MAHSQCQAAKLATDLPLDESALSSDPHVLTDDAKAAYANGELDRARLLFERLEIVDGPSIVASRALARLAVDERRLDEAVERWTMVKEMRPDLWEADLRLGRLYREMGRDRDAIVAYERLAKKNPEHVELARVLPLLRKTLLKGTQQESLKPVRVVSKSSVKASYVSAVLTKARAALEQGETDVAIALWSELGELRPDLWECDLRLGRLYRKSGLIKQAIAAYGRLARSRPEHAEPAKVLPELERALLHRETPMPAITARHIAISGVSYSGSTLLALMLGDLDGAANIGESHWLTETKKRDGRAFDELTHEEIVHCATCGKNGCDVLDREFRNALCADPIHWYQKIAERLGCKTLISADKNYTKLLEKDPNLDLDALVVFKSPMQAWYSNWRKIQDPSLGMNPVRDIAAYLDKWANDYERFLDNFENCGEKVFLQFDAFCEEPEEHFERLCAVLGLKMDARVLYGVGVSDQHRFGGNKGVAAQVRSAEPVRIRPLPACELPPEDIARIEAHERVQQVFERLLTRYRRDFGIIEPLVASQIDAALMRTYGDAKVVALKRQTHIGAARDAERELRIRLLQTHGKTHHARKAEVLERLLRDHDWDAYRAMQSDLQAPQSLMFHGMILKYMNLDYWFERKYRIAKEMGLTTGSRLRILDLGAGPAHFPLVCTMLGHDVICTDIDVSDTGEYKGKHIYDRLVDFFGLGRHTHRIEQFEALPDFGPKFDLVTGFMVKFDTTHVDAEGEHYWDVDQWRFFLEDIAKNVLTESGRLYLKLNRGPHGTNNKFGDGKLISLFEEFGAQVNEANLTVDFCGLGAVVAARSAVG